MGYKVFIVLVWLTLPLSVGLMLHEDHQRFEMEGELQLARSQAWEAHIGDYVRQAGLQARDIDSFDDPYDRVRWEQAWRRTEDLRRSEEGRLGKLALGHFPQTQEGLERALAAAGLQRRSITEAARLKESYLATAESLWKMQQDIDILEDNLRYWQFHQQIGIYLNLQEHLARLESAYRQRRSARNELNRNIAAALHEAEKQAREALGELRQLSAARQQDEALTYRAHLARRFKEFNLRTELQAMLGVSPAQAKTLR
ncbi:hypothetical protein IT575_03825 [bacterium]|nr:hypothetical protein [bacterium]